MQQNNELELSDVDVFIEKTYGYEFLQEVKSVKQTEENDKKYYEWLSEQKIRNKKFTIKTYNSEKCNKMILLQPDKDAYLKDKCCERCFILFVEGRKS